MWTDARAGAPCNAAACLVRMRSSRSWAVTGTAAACMAQTRELHPLMRSDLTSPVK